MPATCVIGLQWGDEAKGKIVDLLTEQHDIVVRYQGGRQRRAYRGPRRPNVSSSRWCPAAFFGPRCSASSPAASCSIRPACWARSTASSSRGVKVGKNLMLSDRAHVIFPWHVDEDRLLDKQCTSGEAIGTTLRGIGPCYRDKVGRSLAVRLGDMYRPDFRTRIELITRPRTRRSMPSVRPGDRLDAQQIFEQYHAYAERLSPHVADTTAYLLDAVEADKRVLFEGRPGRSWTSTTAPFPSSPAATARAWACRPARACPADTSPRSSASSRPIRRGWAAGRFPPKQDNETGEHIRRRGNEYGTVTQAAAALRLVRRRGGPLHRPPQRRRTCWR